MESLKNLQVIHFKFQYDNLVDKNETPGDKTKMKVEQLERGLTAAMF